MKQQGGRNNISVYQNMNKEKILEFRVCISERASQVFFFVCLFYMETRAQPLLHALGCLNPAVFTTLVERIGLNTLSFLPLPSLEMS